jgi:KDO2-lipid IV(A) lauroyltransferase
LRLRDALRNDEVVVMQADRAMEGQRSLKVRFLHGNIEVPLGPVKLAHLTGSPIVPVFVVRNQRGKFRVVLCDPIEVINDDTDAAAIAMARAIESIVRQYPEQWLVLERAFVEEDGE